MPFGWKAPKPRALLDESHRVARWWGWSPSDPLRSIQCRQNRIHRRQSGGIFPWSWAHTCSAEVGESRLERLALGAAKGPWKRWMTACIKGWEGHLRATEFKPAVTSSGMIGFLGTTKVKGPGQKCFARSAAIEHQLAAQVSNIPSSATCTINGLVEGRPLASNIRATAFLSRASWQPTHRPSHLGGQPLVQP